MLVVYAALDSSPPGIMIVLQPARMIVATPEPATASMRSLPTYPYLEREDIMQALRYAAWRAEEREVTLPNA